MSLKAREEPLQDVGPESHAAHRGALDLCCQSACRTARLPARWRSLSAPLSRTIPRSRNVSSSQAAAGPPATPPPRHAMKPIKIFRCGHADCCRAAALQHAAALLNKASHVSQQCLYKGTLRVFSELYMRMPEPSFCPWFARRYMAIPHLAHRSIKHKPAKVFQCQLFRVHTPMNLTTYEAA